MILEYGGLSPRIGADVFIAPTASIIGDVAIGENSSVWFGCVLRGDTNRIRIGASTNIQDGAVIHVNAPYEGARGTSATIGSYVTVGHMALLHACTLEDHCFVGMKACVMDGAVVCANAMVAAGALVTPGKHIASGELWAGSPARFVRRLTERELASNIESARHYRELAARYRSIEKES